MIGPEPQRRAWTDRLHRSILLERRRKIAKSTIMIAVLLTMPISKDEPISAISWKSKPKHQGSRWRATRARTGSVGQIVIGGCSSRREKNAEDEIHHNECGQGSTSGRCERLLGTPARLTWKLELRVAGCRVQHRLLEPRWSAR